jgi:hypothetical protein
MATSTLHDDIMKITNLLVNSVHLVKSPANRKSFFLIKKEKGNDEMNEQTLKENLKKQGLNEDEINYVISNDNIKNILLNEKNEKTALDVLKDGIRNSVVEIENTLQSTEKITDLTSKIVNPLEKLTSFLSPKGEDNKKEDDKKAEDKKDTNNNDDLSDSVSELTNELQGLANDTAELISDMVNE